jgi:hypothetical protein
MSKVLRWLSWTPSLSPFSKGAPPLTDKPTKPTPDGGAVSSVGSSRRASQEMGAEDDGSVSSVSPSLGTSSNKSDDDELPWPRYNNGKRFVCDRCGREFARSVGLAKHKVKEHEFTM